MASGVGYGTHPTIYGSYSDEALMDLYRESSWFCMGEESRQQLLQETVNRAAAAKGELGACEVRFADLDSGTLGEQSGNVISVNRSVFAQDTYQHEYNGHMIEERAFDSNMRALETKEDIVMDKGYTPVTAEDYESSMRSTVNAFYEHEFIL